MVIFYTLNHCILHDVKKSVLLVPNDFCATQYDKIFLPYKNYLNQKCNCIQINMFKLLTRWNYSKIDTRLFVTPPAYFTLRLFDDTQPQHELITICLDSVPQSIFSK